MHLRHSVQVFEKTSELYPYSIRAYQRDICRNERQWVINQVGLDGCMQHRTVCIYASKGWHTARRMDGQRKDNDDDDASEMCTRYVYLLIYMRLYTICMYIMCWLKMGNKICCCWHGTGLKGAGIAHRRGRDAD